jgi:outer membrane receptor for ferric coprogen and ferric-rhodotorulic acid
MRYYPNSNDTLTSFLTNAVVDASMRLPLVCALALVAGTAFGHTEQPGTTLLASAEPLVTSTDTGLSDVVVTATRQSTKLQETPVAVTVMTGSDLAEQNLTTARDLAGKTPGVVILRSGITTSTAVTPTIRRSTNMSTTRTPTAFAASCSRNSRMS